VIVYQESEIIDDVEVETDFTDEKLHASEILKLILNPLEYLGLLERKKKVVLDELALQFARALRICWNSEEIRKYIAALREQNRMPTLYQEFERLATKLEEYQVRKG
jgi:hypothetical protein